MADLTSQIEPCRGQTCRGVQPTRRDATGVTVGNSAPASASQARPPKKSGLNTAGLLAVVNGALVGVGSVYLTTRSLIVTLIAALSAVILGSLVMLAR
jgi:hypothetical protein